MVSPTVASNAYASLARIMDSAGSAGAGIGKSAEAGGPSFGAMLKDAIGSVMDVVTAVAETDVAVSTLVSVRDRVIQSYEDIMKMSI